MTEQRLTKVGRFTRVRREYDLPPRITPATGVAASSSTCSSRLMTVASLSQHLHEFAVELRRLAYTMPGGYEDPLIHLSERMVRCAREQVPDSSH